MAAKKYLLFILLAMCTLASAQAQLVFEPSTWDFGAIREVDGRVSHTFTGINRGTKPLVILNVVTTCGCTIPEFSQQPVAPGGRTQITVTFDPSNRPGVFDKDLDVYSSERKKIATLTLRGSVTARPKSIEELYPVDAGNGLRLSTTLNAFSYIYQGQQTQGSVSYANTSRGKITLNLKAQESSGLLRIDFPRQIAPGEQGEINLSYLIPGSQPRYGTLKDVFEVIVNGRGNGTTLVVHGIGVDPPKQPGEAAPRVQFSENILKFGSVKRTAPVQRLRFTLSNEGDIPLIVRAAEHGKAVTTTLAPGQQIPAGETFTAEVAFDPRKQEFGVMSDHLIVITNDPARPMRRLRITAIVEE